MQPQRGDRAMMSLSAAPQTPPAPQALPSQQALLASVADTKQNHSLCKTSRWGRVREASSNGPQFKRIPYVILFPRSSHPGLHRGPQMHWTLILQRQPTGSSRGKRRYHIGDPSLWIPTHPVHNRDTTLSLHRPCSPWWKRDPPHTYTGIKISLLITSKSRHNQWTWPS